MAAKRRASPTHVECQESQKALSFVGFGAPFLEKGPPQITEGGLFDPHWPVSRINPGLLHIGKPIILIYQADTLLKCQKRKRKTPLSPTYKFSMLISIHSPM